MKNYNLPKGKNFDLHPKIRNIVWKEAEAVSVYKQVAGKEINTLKKGWEEASENKMLAEKNLELIYIALNNWVDKDYRDAVYDWVCNSIPIEMVVRMHYRDHLDDIDPKQISAYKIRVQTKRFLYGLADIKGIIKDVDGF